MAKEKSRKNLDNLKNLLDFFENLNYNLDSQKKATNPARQGGRKEERFMEKKVTVERVGDKYALYINDNYAGLYDKEILNIKLRAWHLPEIEE